MKSKVIILSVLIVLVLCINSYAGDKIGYIDVRRIVSESNLGKDARAEMDKIREKRNTAIQEKNAELEKLGEKFKSKSQEKNIDREELKELIEEIQQKDKELKRFVADVKEELTKIDQELVAEILQKADPVLKEIAKDKGYSVILREPNVLAYIDEDVDITDKVIKKLNKLR